MKLSDRSLREFFSRWDKSQDRPVGTDAPTLKYGIYMGKMMPHVTVSAELLMRSCQSHYGWLIVDNHTTERALQSHRCSVSRPQGVIDHPRDRHVNLIAASDREVDVSRLWQKLSCPNMLGQVKSRGLRQSHAH